MRKLKLQVEQLQVSTFTTNEVQPAAGTVHGATGANTCMTCVQYTGCRADNFTCYQTCFSCIAGPSCDSGCESVNCPNYPDM